MYLDPESLQHSRALHEAALWTLGQEDPGTCSEKFIGAQRPLLSLQELLYPNTDIYCQINPKVDVVS